MMSLDPLNTLNTLTTLNTLNTLNPRPLAGIADCELHALFRRPEIAVSIKNRRAAVLPSPEGLLLAFAAKPYLRESAEASGL